MVVAAGAHTPSVLKGLGTTIPIQPAKGYSLTFQQQAGMPKIPIILEEGHIAMTPLEKTFRITGILELCGLDRRILPKRIKTIFNPPQLIICSGKPLNGNTESDPVS